MRTLLLMLFLPIYGFGQASQNDPPSRQVIQDSIPGTSIILKDGNILFKKAYASNLEKEALSDQLYTLLSLIKGFKPNDERYRAVDQITGRLSRHNINMNKYATSDILNKPINAMVLVQLKDLKYQVIVSEISFGETYTDSLKHELTRDVMLESYITEKKGSKLRSRKVYVKLAQILNQELTDLFDLQKSNLAAEF
ncbi:MAG TPA: hypothetical protein VK541_06075 [Pedobacter sp.]|uniref:hypothetical protein n=1 Tax=Pedobacter sp. TaxID=1411316 RepID=UPI002BCBC420|nr:hypothetical protein [Pedobacter sp.]HMI02029.1 hypothetical protein [Pedobacter sp.]